MAGWTNEMVGQWTELLAKENREFLRRRRPELSKKPPKKSSNDSPGVSSCFGITDEQKDSWDKLSRYQMDFQGKIGRPASPHVPGFGLKGWKPSLAGKQLHRSNSSPSVCRQAA
eukprot:gnl/MRDRNA2_/MRDRNA2_269385_c0_seq1.p1 gnl/MRDRNA2_/MRDRNA2_269385_c0~~gnl/MRDRNA2_/MRDRNA2_269385_c0_seq1.p1  ORF type:complete len:114 (+),score=21.24 gnl/MRDRNA2_/MRDRNA2_269385_c0_seq1:110-451(+)